MTHTHTQRQHIEPPESWRYICIVERVLLAVLTLSLILPLSTSFSSIEVFAFDPVLVLLVLVWGFRVFIFEKELALTTHDLLFYALLLWMVISAAVAVNSLLALSGIALWIRAVVLFTIVRSQYGSIYDKRDIVTMAVVLFTIQVTIATLQGMTQTDIGALNQYFGTKEPVRSFYRVGGTMTLRAQGTLGSPNTVASWIVALLPFVGIGAASEYKSSQYRFWGLAVLGVVALLFTLSRGAILILFGISIVGFFLINRRSRLTQYILYSTPMLIFVIVGLLIGGQSRLTTIGQSISKRLELIDIALKLIQQFPLFGVGYNNFVVGFRTLLGEDLFVRSETTGPHNIPLLFASETGIIGGVLFLAVGVFIFRTFIRTFMTQCQSAAYAASFVLSTLSIAGVSLFYITLTSFQFLPLAVVILAAGIGMCTTEYL